MSKIVREEGVGEEVYVDRVLGGTETCRTRGTTRASGGAEPLFRVSTPTK